VSSRSSEGLIVRKAAPDDGPALLAYYAELAQETDTYLSLMPGEYDSLLVPGSGVFERYHSSENSLFLVAEMDAAIVGVLSLDGGQRPPTRHSATLGITVRRAQRGRGVGSALIDRALAWARESGALERIDLQVFTLNEGARRLYERFGFEMEGRLRRAVRWHGELHDCYCMALLL
jgi:RimJ/RimL family protein N-acetyltransferase